MQDIAQNSKRWRIHWCPQALTHFANSGAIALTVLLLPIVGTNSLCSIVQWFSFLGSSTVIHKISKENLYSESQSERWRHVKQVEVVEINLIREQLAKQKLLLRLAPTELAQEDRRPTSCWRLLGLVLLLHRWSHIKEYIYKCVCVCFFLLNNTNDEIKVMVWRRRRWCMEWLVPMATLVVLPCSPLIVLEQLARLLNWLFSLFC